MMLAMPFIAEQRVARQPRLELLPSRDIVEILKETLPRKPEGKDALLSGSTSASSAGEARLSHDTEHNGSRSRHQQKSCHVISN